MLKEMRQPSMQPSMTVMGPGSIPQAQVSNNWHVQVCAYYSACICVCACVWAFVCVCVRAC